MGDIAALINKILENLSSPSSLSTWLNVAFIIRSEASAAFQEAVRGKKMK